MPDTVAPVGNAKTYFIYMSLLYLGLNFGLVPIQNWVNMYVGFRFGNDSLLWYQFNQGNMFFYSIMLNSDTIFRAIQYFTEKSFKPDQGRGATDIIVPILLGSALIIIIFVLFNYSELRSQVEHKTIPGFPAADQCVFASVSLVIGYVMYKHTTLALFASRGGPTTNGPLV